MDKLRELKDVTGGTGPQAHGYAPVYDSISDKFILQKVVTSTARLAKSSEVAIPVLVETAQDAVGSILVDSSSINFTYDDAVPSITAVVLPAGVDHGGLGGLTDDDHTQYARLAGRAGGQTLQGGTAASEVLTLESTAHATKAHIIASPGGSMMVGYNAAPATAFEVRAATGGLTLTRDSDTAAAEPFIHFRHGTTPAGLGQMRGISTGGIRWTDTTATTEWMRVVSTGLIIANSLRIESDELRARDSGGLLLLDDSGTAGIKIHDGGKVVVGSTSASAIGGLLSVVSAMGSGNDNNVFTGYAADTTGGAFFFRHTANNDYTFGIGSSSTSKIRFDNTSSGNMEVYLAETGGGVTVGDTTSPGVGVLRVGGTIGGSGGAALYLDSTTNASAGSQYGLRVVCDPQNAGQFVGIGVHGSPNFTNYKASIWIGNESNRPGLNIGYANTTLAPTHGAIILGQVGIGDSSPDGMLDAVQGSTTAAIPVVELEQLDLSEEFINFVGTVATGNPIEAVGAKTLTTTHFVRVAFNGTLRYIPIGTIA